jgi:hypothetical protein
VVAMVLMGQDNCRVESYRSVYTSISTRRGQFHRVTCYDPVVTPTRVPDPNSEAGLLSTGPFFGPHVAISGATESMAT